MPHALIVDDNEENLYLLEQLLKNSGFAVTAARNGAEAMETAKKNPPDLIISDILMPVLDGFSLCRAWKQDPVLTRIPFVFYTATYTDPKDEEFALSLGADEFIIKPKDPVDFLRIIDKVLARHLQGELRAKTGPLPSEDVYLKEYNQALIRKLEDKLEQIGKVNKQLSEKDAFSRAVLNAMPAQVAVIDENENVFAVNKRWEECAQDISGLPLMRAKTGEPLFGARDNNAGDASAFEQSIQEKTRALLQGKLPDFEIECSGRILTKEHWFLLRITPLGAMPGAVVAYFDITSRKILEERLKSTLMEKETLLRELFHRTKNNMQVISSVLALQCQRTESPEARRIIQDTESRIQALSLVFRQLYKTQNLSRIDLQEYLTELANLVFATFGTPADKVALVLEIDKEWVLFDIAIPCGLVANELLTNALMHAFPLERTGRIAVRLHRVAPGELELEIADNGMSIPEDVDIENLPSLGIQLVRTIVTKQLKGNIRFETDRGFRCRIRFKDTLYHERV